MTNVYCRMTILSCFAWHFPAFSTENKAKLNGQSSWLTGLGAPRTARDLHTHSVSVNIAPAGCQLQMINYFIAKIFLPDVSPIYPVRHVPGMAKFWREGVFSVFELQKFRSFPADLGERVVNRCWFPSLREREESGE